MCNDILDWALLKIVTLVDKECNTPPTIPHPRLPRARTPPPLSSLLDMQDSCDDSADHWAPRHGLIVIKVWVPSTDDIWAFRVPEAESLAAFRARVAEKVGFAVRLEGKNARTRARMLKEEGTFRTWVRGRVRSGRNHLLTAHRA
ncbi:hypothetical protein SCP_1102540 [Sparassis crispa]|uniref:Uncharacterized protein n=1 Tax=Sparassis crispa TaxID=139825 RepID=A0A401GZH5_9APHY|nr:hypothetical protein SCP_1102540 [Sparassis crispa]GBE87577.1 hypothetical protein SCP_1102540 [Sparassis crispa]